MSTERYPSGETLMAEAVAETGLTDFGPGDFREGLDVMIESLRTDAHLSPTTDEAVVGLLRRRLVNRLKIEAWYVAHPEIDDLPVDAPIDIIGLPRTGTSALASLMSPDPQLRPLRIWEQAEPCPPPKTETEATDPRRLAALAVDESVSEDLKAAHIWDSDATMEDGEVLGMAFHGQQFTLPVYGYHAWWRGADSTETFAYHRRVIKLLQSQRPPYLWLFKSPHHKFHLEPIVAAYPDVRFVWTHRDPAKAIPSYSSFVSKIFPAPDGERDLTQVGHEVSEHLRIGMESAMAARARLGEDRFLDVHHRDLAGDPVGTLQRIYDWLGLKLTPEFERTVADWHEQNGLGAHGTHRYTPEQFGLSRAQVREDFADYIRHFDVEIEA